MHQAFERLIRNPILLGISLLTHPNSIHSSMTSKVCDIDLLKFSTVSNSLQTNTRVVFCVSKNSRSRFLRLVSAVRFVAKRYIHPTAKESERRNRTLPAKKTLVQLLALHTNPESHNAQRHRQTHGRAGCMMMPRL